jgi:NAD-dependent SIR2 family protein deacetylase
MPMRPFSEIQWRGEGPDAVCEHGTAADVHCCNCHHGFLFAPYDCECTDDDDDGDVVVCENCGGEPAARPTADDVELCEECWRDLVAAEKAQR